MNIKFHLTVFLITVLTIVSTMVLIKLLQLYTHVTMGLILFAILYFLVYQIKKRLESD